MAGFSVPKPVLSALEKLECAGYPAFLVGGCVRDLLRGVEPHDFDMTTLALPQETERVFAGLPVLKTGIQHGTVTVLQNGISLEITTYRADGTYSDGRHPDFVRFARTPEEDLRRRDFTVNAMAWSPSRGLVDPCGGQADLKKQLLRCVGDPETRFSEDALRILRGARFASCLGFTVEPETKAAMLRLAPLLKRVSGERISAEFLRLLCGKKAEEVLLQFRELIALFLPEIRPCFDFDQRTPHHCYDVYLHTVKVVAAVPPEPTLRLAAFFHDIGKPATFTFRDGSGHFKGHPECGAAICEEALCRLRLPKKQIREVCLLVREHDFSIENEGRGAIYLLQRLPKELIEPLLLLMEADARAKADPVSSLERVRALRQELADLRQKPLCLSLKDLAIGGDDLLEAGIPAGPAVGKLLRALLERVIAGELENDRECLVKEAIAGIKFLR